MHISCHTQRGVRCILHAQNQCRQYNTGNHRLQSQPQPQWSHSSRRSNLTTTILLMPHMVMGMAPPQHIQLVPSSFPNTSSSRQDTRTVANSAHTKLDSHETHLTPDSTLSPALSSDLDPHNK